jgi:hypothetical protein
MNTDEMKMMMDEDKEIWVPVKGFEGYEISTKGRFRSYWKKGFKNLKKKLIKTPKYLKIHKSITTGYYMIGLSNDDGQKPTNVHHLLAVAFIPNPENLPCVDHIDRDRTNNALSNLRWASYQQNNTNVVRKKKNSSGIRGVGITEDGRQKKYYAHAKIGEEKVKLYFYTLEEAEACRDEMVKQHYDQEFYNKN